MDNSHWHKCRPDALNGKLEVRIGWNGWEKVWQLHSDSYDFNADKTMYTHTNTLININYCPFCGKKLGVKSNEQIQTNELEE